MRTQPFLLLAGWILASACSLTPALESPGERGFRPTTLGLEGWTPVVRAESSTAPPVAPAPPGAPESPFQASPRSDANQTMGGGKIDVVLDAGNGEGVAASEQDPWAWVNGLPETEPVDDWAAMSSSERAAAGRQTLDEIANEPDDPDERAEPDDPRDAPVEEFPDEPGDDPDEEPHSVLWYLDNRPPPSIQRFLPEDAPPATRQPAYDLLALPGDPSPADVLQGDANGQAISTPTLGPGIYVHPVGPTNADYAVGDPTLSSLVLGQPFHVSVAVPLEQADPDGDGAVNDLTIEFATEDGEATVTLAHDALQDTRDGVFVYRTATPISLAGKSQGMDVSQIVDVRGVVDGLDLDSYGGARTVTITVGDQDFSAIDVYTNNTQRGIGMISDALDAVSNVLVGEIAIIRKIRSDPEAMADPNVVAELDAWQTRVDDRMAVVQRARTLISNPDEWPIVKLEMGQFYLERLFAADENGQLAVAEQIVPFSGFETQNMYADLVNMDYKVSVLTNGIRDRARQGLIEDVLPAYLMGIYDQYNTWNVPGAFAWTVGGALAGESTDHFGREKSVTHAAVEMGLFVVMIKLPDAITEWAAGGFGTGRLPSIGVPRFRGTPVRGNVLVPKRAGRLALETRGGTQAYPGSATRPIHSLPQAERDWWQGFIASHTPADQYDNAMAKAIRELDELDLYIQNAQRLGVSYPQIEGALASARMRANSADEAFQGLRNGVAQAKSELVVHAANAEGKTIVVHPAEMQQFREFSDGLPVTSLRQEDLLMIQGIKSRAEFEARHGGQPMYNPDEVAYARELLQHGDDLKNWVEFSSSEGGLQHMFDDAAIGDLRKVFGGTGPPAERISPRAGFPRLETRQQIAEPAADAAPANPFTSRGDTPDLPPGGQAAGRPPTQELSPAEMEQAILNAETVRFGRPGRPEDARPLATVDEYRALVARQAAGEQLDLKQIARPGIARVIDGRVLIQQGSGRWENTRPNEWLDLFVDARAALPEGAVVLQRGISPELVRQANLLSSRGQSGSNPPIVNAATAGIPEFVRIRVRARDAQAPMSDVARAIDDGLTRLAAEGVDLTNLRLAMEPLSPNERLALLQNESSRAHAIGTGTAPLPPPPPPPGGAGAATTTTSPAPPTAGQPRMSELDQRVIQKGFKAARGENVEWTPEEMTRLQQIAYPPSGARPSAIQQRLMPVAEQLGGQMKTQRQDARTFGEALDQANEGFLAHQEMENLIALARLVGVPETRIQLHTEGLSEGMPATVLERASRGLLREVDQARGIVQESGVPDEYFIVTRMYVAAKHDGNRLADADVAWLRERMDADETFIQKLAQREFEDAAGEDYTIMTPSGAQDLESMYRAATGEGAPVSLGPPPSIDPGSGAGAALLGGPSGRGAGDAPVEVVVLSTEGSTGPVMEAFFLNKGKAVRIQGQGIALEPVASVDAATLQRIEEIREAALQGKPVPGGAEDMDGWTGASVVRIVLDAYCLEADLAVPTRGMLYRIADPARQAAFGSLRPILEASERLRAQGQLHPSNNAEDYFHSIRQWALWVDEKDMDAEEFEDAFVAHAERNIVAAGQNWNDEVERVVRNYAPGRWQDVVAVLEAAGVR